MTRLIYFKFQKFNSNRVEIYDTQQESATSLHKTIVREKRHDNETYLNMSMFYNNDVRRVSI